MFIPTVVIILMIMAYFIDRLSPWFYLPVVIVLLLMLN